LPRAPFPGSTPKSKSNLKPKSKPKPKPKSKPKPKPKSKPKPKPKPKIKTKTNNQNPKSEPKIRTQNQNQNQNPFRILLDSFHKSNHKGAIPILAFSVPSGSSLDWKTLLLHFPGMLLAPASKGHKVVFTGCLLAMVGGLGV
jgi:hypothetical protein